MDAEAGLAIVDESGLPVGKAVEIAALVLEGLTVGLSAEDVALELEGLSVGDAALVLEGLTVRLRVGDAALVPAAFAVTGRIWYENVAFPGGFPVETEAVSNGFLEASTMLGLSFCKEEAVDAFCIGAGVAPEINFWVDDGLPASEKPFAEDCVLEDDPWAADGVPKGVPRENFNVLAVAGVADLVVGSLEIAKFSLFTAAFISFAFAVPFLDPLSDLLDLLEFSGIVILDFPGPDCTALVELVENGRGADPRGLLTTGVPLLEVTSLLGFAELEGDEPAGVTGTFGAPLIDTAGLLIFALPEPIAVPVGIVGAARVDNAVEF